MKWLLAGASGFLGTALRVRLASEGHDVVRLVRREPATAAEFRWDPATGEVDPAAFAGVGTVVNLGGVAVFSGRWTAARREAILSSRVTSTDAMARALAALPGDKPTLIQASGISYYPMISGAEPYTEDSPAGQDFLAQVTLQWEAATRPATDAGVRTVLLRTSPVIDRSGGALVPMKLAWSLGLGATLGSGRQRMPLIALDDYLGVVQWAATGSAVGAYNLTIPEPTTNATFSAELAAQLHRPRLFTAPAPVVQAVLGELSGELLGDMHVVPARLQAHGYRFFYPDVASAIGAALRRPPA